MPSCRIIARLDIKGANLIKGIHLEGLRVIGSPNEHAVRYYQEGVDELIYMDCVASLYGRNSLADIVQATTRDVFIPLTVGGGVRSLQDAHDLLRSGADKIAVNTAAVATPQLITEIARKFGSQCVVISIEAKQVGPDRWEAYTENGREPSGRDVVDWAREAVSLGAGEVLLTSVDREGTRKGFDLSLTRAVADAVDVPLIASGGMGSPQDAVTAVKQGHARAVAMADILHYRRSTIPAIRQTLHEADISVRNVGLADVAVA
jgi:imidazole glycerol-phosphate synthase subunit HisF